MNELYAHTPNEKGELHYLDAHMKEVAELAEKFAGKFGASKLANWIGLWHDLGKSNPAFQDYLNSCQRGERHEKVPHAIWGAVLAYQLIRQNKEDDRWKEIALTIAGHHVGMDQPGSLSQKLEECMQKNHELFQLIAEHAKILPSPPQVNLPEMTRTQRELFVRMVFSALVDADYLNTEKHFNEKQYVLRQKQHLIGSLWSRFDANQKQFVKAVDTETTVNKIRREVYELCYRMALGKTGIYRMTVPTGGGKTRSSLAFALRHAVKNEMDRVIVVIPYTSIIDQTAKEYRKILGSDAVLEHHSQVSVPSDESQDATYVSLRLATENWDVTLIVTTTVQFFESLFSNKPGKVRKLHNLSRSVVVIDEVQALPPELLTPTLDVLRALVEGYGVSIILCTATQPAFEESHYLKPFQGLQVHEIVPKEIYQEHFRKLERVKYYRKDNPISWQGNRWYPFPVEYKRGKPKANNCDKVQLCAQAICLEEMLSCNITEGALFYGTTRRRHDVVLDTALRTETEESAKRVHELISAGITPKPEYSKKCKKCSLLELCMPKTCGKTGKASSYLLKMME